MEWSPLFASGAWSPQWLCRQCCRTVGDPPSFPRVSCSRCGEQCSVFVTDFSSGDSGMWCPSCQLRTECVNPQSRLVLQDCERPQPNWFTHSPLSTFGHLYGWGAVPISPPGSGSQSWLLCPLISLGLLDAEHARGVPAYSTGSRLPVPDQQRTYWMAHAMDIIHAFCQHFQSLIPQCAVAQGLHIIFLGSRRSPPWFLPRRMYALLTSPHCSTLGSARSAICSTPQTFFRPLRVHAFPTPLPVRHRFNLVTSPNQVQRTVLFLRLLFVFQKFPWRSQHLHSALLLR